MKKLLSAMLILVLALSALAATAVAEGEGGTVRMLVNVTGGKDEEENALWAEALGAATGLTIELEKPASDYGNILMQKLSAGESYDLIYIDASQYANLVDQGALTDITDYIANSEILSNNVPESEWEDLKVGGRIYAGFNKRELHILVNLNKVMLENAGIDYTQIEPTLDGYYEVFKALREANPSEDFYPFNTILSENWDLQPWMASQGLKGGVVVDETDGQTYVPYATDAAAPVPIYKDFVNPIGMNLGVEEALTYLDYASIETIIPNESDYKSIVGKWGISIVRGEVETLEGLASMREELVSMGICDK